MFKNKEVLIITGACGVGKTSTAREWAKAKNGAIIECDYLTEWIYKNDFPHWTDAEETFTSELASLMAIEYLANDMSVAIENVWSPKGINAICAKLSKLKDIKITAVRLKCDLKENHVRDQKRIPENQMKGRVDIVNKELDSYQWPTHIKTIDTTNLSLNDVLNEIANR